MHRLHALLLLILASICFGFPLSSELDGLPGNHPSDFVNSTECVNELLYCKNGGWFNMSNCWHKVYCGYDPPGWDNWWTQYNCTCPTGYVGTDCSIAAPPSIMGDGNDVCSKQGLKFDGQMLNLNNTNKHLECFLNLPASAPDMMPAVRLHRINVTISLDAQGNGGIYFDLTSRHRNSSEETAGPCWPQKHDLNCSMTQCTGGLVNGIPSYTCQKAVCDSCGDPKYGLNELCPVLEWLLLGKGIVAPVTITFDAPDPHSGMSGMTLPTRSLTIKGQCRTGMCVQSFDQPIIPTTNSTWLVIAVTTCFGGGLLLSVGAAIFLNRRPKGEKIALDGDDDYFVEESANPSPGISSVYPAKAPGLGAVNVLDEAYIANLPRFGLLFDRVTYDVPTSDWLQLRFHSPPKRILNGITGIVRPGELVAIMGSSGAGKSSFMNIISQRIMMGTVGGDVALFSDSMRAKSPKDVISYVLQDDRMMNTMTVREALLFSGRMRLPQSFTESMIYAKVHRLIQQLGLKDIADNKIGSSEDGKGSISGGERKRLAIGMELIAHPRLLLLDEPTSGLDSVSAEIVMKVLRRTANAGCACIVSIHQPPAKVFSMFDKLLLLTKGGHQAFYGPPLEALDHMKQLGFDPITQWMNPAEYLLSVAAEQKADRLAQGYRQSPACQSVLATIHDLKMRSKVSSLIEASPGVALVEVDPYEANPSLISPLFSPSASSANLLQKSAPMGNGGSLSERPSSRRVVKRRPSINASVAQNFSENVSPQIRSQRPSSTGQSPINPEHKSPIVSISTYSQDEESKQRLYQPPHPNSAGAPHTPGHKPTIIAALSRSNLMPTEPLSGGTPAAHVTPPITVDNPVALLGDWRAHGDDDAMLRASRSVSAPGSRSGINGEPTEELPLPQDGALLDEAKAQHKSRRMSKQIPYFTRKHPAEATRFSLLCARAFMNIIRDPTLLLLQAVVTCLVGVLVGMIFRNLDNRLSGIQNRAGSLFFIVLFFTLMSLSSMGELLNERLLFNRERAAGYYSTGPYFLCKLLCDFIPLRVLPPIVFSAICYWMVGYQDDAFRFILFVSVLILVNICATSVCFLISTVCQNIGTANMIASLWFIYCFVYGGLLLNSKTGSKLIVLQYGSFVHYAWEALMLNELSGLELIFDPANAGEFDTSGGEVLDIFGLKPDWFFIDVLALLGFFQLCLYGTYLFLLPPGTAAIWTDSDLDKRNGEMRLKPIHVLSDDQSHHYEAIGNAGDAAYPSTLPDDTPFLGPGPT